MWAIRNCVYIINHVWVLINLTCVMEWSCRLLVCGLSITMTVNNYYYFGVWTFNGTPKLCQGTTAKDFVRLLNFEKLGSYAFDSFPNWKNNNIKFLLLFLNIALSHECKIASLHELKNFLNSFAFFIKFTTFALLWSYWIFRG